MKQNDIISEEKTDHIGSVVKGLLVFSMLIGAVFTGYHTHHLFYRGMGETEEAFMFAFIPVMLLEGTVLVTFAAKFYYFTTVKQHNIGGWAMWGGIAILIANTVLNHTYNTGDQGILKPVLQVYSLVMLPATPILAIVYVKELLGIDPKVIERVDETMHSATINRKLSAMTRDAYNSPQVTEALNAKRDMMADVIAQQIVSGMLSAKGTSQFADYDVRRKSAIALPKPNVDNADERVSKAAAALSAPSGPTQAEIGAMIQAAVAKALANAQPQAVAMNADAPTQARIIEAQSPK